MAPAAGSTDTKRRVYGMWMPRPNRPRRGPWGVRCREKDREAEIRDSASRRVFARGGSANTEPVVWGHSRGSACATAQPSCRHRPFGRRPSVSRSGSATPQTLSGRAPRRHRRAAAFSARAAGHARFARYADGMFEILVVCTGNICRSPLAEVVLRGTLEQLGGRVHSAGTQGLDAAPMTPEAQRLVVAMGADAGAASAHRSRYLTAAHLDSPDLILAMSREHRGRVAQLAPARLRSSFTVREFARLATGIPDADTVSAVASAGPDAAARVRAAVAIVAARRGLSAPPDDPADDDVVDPYRRPWATYQLSAAQMSPGLDQVARVVSLATR